MISIIAAVGKNYELGKQNQLIWSIPEDMKFFKETTIGHKVVMGRNTYLSIPKHLPDREMIVISDVPIEDNEIKVYDNIEDIITNYKNIEEEVFIIGGASIYKQFVDHADKIYLTEIDSEDKEADVYFPSFDKEKFTKSVLQKGTYNDVNYQMNLYKKEK